MTALRMATADDLSALDRLYAAAFPDEDLRPLVHALARTVPNAPSLVAVDGDRIVGHGLVTPGRVEGTQGQAVEVALLGPVAVTPERQRQGLGRRLVEAAVEAARAGGAACVLVLGDPAFYGRLGFEAEGRITPPFPLPTAWAAAWQSRATGAATSPARRPSGRLELPDPWMVPALWAP